MDGGFNVYVSKDTFKFNAAHFVAFEGYRERLHGHNYRVGVRLMGCHKINPDGYVLDFGDVKDATRKICKRLNDHFICPIHSNVLRITEDEKAQQISIDCEDGTYFSFPSDDVVKLPIVHASSEELAVYLWSEILTLLKSSHLMKRGIHTMEISVAEAPGQEAQFRWPIPKGGDDPALDVRKFVAQGTIVPIPCRPEASKRTPPAKCCPDCGDSKASFSKQLENLAKAMNDKGMVNETVSKDDLEALLNA